MIEHAMKYVQLSQKVRAELRPRPGIDFDVDAHVLYVMLLRSESELHRAEQALVAAYGTWRDGMQAAADLGNERAAEALRRTTWDLT